MNKGFQFIISIPLALLLLLTGCATRPPVDTNESPGAALDSAVYPNIAHLSADQRSQLYFSILLANIAAQQDLKEIAQSNYLDAAERTGSIELARRATSAALEQHRYDQASEALQIWIEQAPQDVDAHKALWLTAVATHRYDEANQLQQKLLSILPKSLDEQLYHLIQAATYQDNADFIHYFNQASSDQQQPVMQTLEAYLLLNSSNPNFYRNRIHRLLDAVLQEAPNFLSAIELKGEALALESREQRDRYLSDVVKSKRLNPAQTFELGELLYTQQNYQAAVLAFQQVVRKQPDNHQARFLLAGSQYALEQYQASAQHFWLLSRLNYKKAITSYYCADSFLRTDEIADAISCYEMVPPGNYYYTARTRMAQLLAERGQWQYAVKSLQQAQQRVGLHDKQRLLQFEIDFLMQIRQFELAAERIDNALQIAPNKTSLYFQKLQLANQTQPVAEFVDSVKQLQITVSGDQLYKDITVIGARMLQARHSHLDAYLLLDEAVKRYPQDAELLYVKALAAEPLGYYEQLEHDLRTVLALKPDHHAAMNALGYTLADLNRSLEEARTLIEKAYQQDPDNSAVLDSMGWVQYRLGNLQQALEFLELAYQAQPLPEVAAHLGEVLWMLNQKDKATEIWRRALKRAPNNQYIIKTLQRFPEAQINS